MCKCTPWWTASFPHKKKTRPFRLGREQTFAWLHSHPIPLSQIISNSFSESLGCFPRLLGCAFEGSHGARRMLGSSVLGPELSFSTRRCWCLGLDQYRGRGGGLCIRGCLAAPQSSVHEVPVVTPLPPGDNPGSLQTLTSGPWKANLLPSGER